MVRGLRPRNPGYLAQAEPEHESGVFNYYYSRRRLADFPLVLTCFLPRNPNSFCLTWFPFLPADSSFSRQRPEIMLGSSTMFSPLFPVDSLTPWQPPTFTKKQPAGSFAS